jgi:hypothetical protein
MSLRRSTAWWIRQVDAGWGARAGGSLSTALAQSTSSDGIVDTRHLGELLAARSHSIDEILDWTQVLATRNRRHARRLLGPSSDEHIAAGWADRTLAGDTGGVGVQVEELTLRITERFALATSLGVPADELTALVVARIEPAGNRPTVECLAAAVTHARSVFRHGETVAQHPGGHVLVLTDRSRPLQDNLAAWKRRLDDDAMIDSSTIWIEPMGSDAALIDSLLVGLVTRS